jgi:hypothetical protein
VNLTGALTGGSFILPFPKYPEGDPKPKRLLGLGERHIDAVCPGAKLNTNEKGSSPVKCLGSGQFKVGDDVVTFDQISCSRSIREEVVKTDVPCGPLESLGRILHIGWRHGNYFSRQISVCHDVAGENTHYANHTIYGQALGALYHGPGRPSRFKEGGNGLYEKSSASTSYKLKTQESTLKAVLGPTAGGRVFNQRKSFFLSRGHLAPDADFLYKEWQYATYYFFNVAPQWQSFNNGNWKAVEIAVRDYAGKAGIPISVLTGTFGHLALKDDGGVERKLYMEKSGKPLIPVPEFFWKIAYDRLSAIVFVGLNNPHFDGGDPAVEASICPDRCDAAKWFFGHRKEIKKGFLYCCSYQDFKAAVPWAPDLGDPKLMQNFLPEVN